MNFDLEGILNEAKDKAVEAATKKFGVSTTPIAEEVADKLEQTVAGRMGVTLDNAAPDGQNNEDNSLRERKDRHNAALSLLMESNSTKRYNRVTYCVRASSSIG